MPHESVEDETTVNDSYSITVPAAVRKRAGIEAGDKLRWHVDEQGDLSVEIVKQRYGAFSELEPIETDEKTDAATDHDRIAGDY
jgi:AbrB family looped-hinge helix DNA binding protein